jgi:hypothetical protein
MVSPMKMGGQAFATHQIFGTAVASCKTSEIPRYGPPDGLWGHDVATPDPSKRATFAMVCAKKGDGNSVHGWVMAFFLRCYHQNIRERGPMRQTRGPSSWPRVDFIITALQPMHR